MIRSSKFFRHYLRTTLPEARFEQTYPYCFNVQYMGHTKRLHVDPASTRHEVQIALREFTEWCSRVLPL